MSEPHENYNKRSVYAILESEMIELRGESGKLYARLDPRQMRLEFRRGERIEYIDLGQYLDEQHAAAAMT